MERYRQVIRDFLAHLGPRAKASIASISPGDLINFRDKLRGEGRSAYTCNTVVKRVLNIPFEAARKLGFITVNPVTAVDSLRDRGAKLGREPFTSAELVRLLEVAEGDWRGAILLGVDHWLAAGRHHQALLGERGPQCRISSFRDGEDRHDCGPADS